MDEINQEKDKTLRKITISGEKRRNKKRSSEWEEYRAWRISREWSCGIQEIRNFQKDINGNNDNLNEARCQMA